MKWSLKEYFTDVALHSYNIIEQLKNTLVSEIRACYASSG